jgi:hypothetical protein
LQPVPTASGITAQPHRKWDCSPSPRQVGLQPVPTVSGIAARPHGKWDCSPSPRLAAEAARRRPEKGDGVSPVPAQMWRGASPPSPGADVGDLLSLGDGARRRQRDRRRRPAAARAWAGGRKEGSGGGRMRAGVLEYSRAGARREGRGGVGAGANEEGEWHGGTRRMHVPLSLGYARTGRRRARSARCFRRRG